MKRTIIYMLTAPAILLSSCISDHFRNEHTQRNDFFNLTVTVDEIGTGVEAETRATVPSVGDEDKVNTLYLLFFEQKSDQSGQYAGSMEYTDDPQMNMTISMTAAGLSNDRDYSILALANIEKFIGAFTVADFLSMFVDMTESQAEMQTRLEITGVGTDEDDDSSAIGQNGLAMSGKTTKKSGENEVVLKLTRVVSRFDVQNTRSSQYDMVSVSIWNANSNTYPWPDIVNDDPQILTRRFYGLKRSIPADGTLEDIVGGLYAFENLHSSPSPDDENTTCLIVGLASRTGTAIGTEGETMYYRINIHPEGASQNLKRNFVYKISIRNVYNEGAPSEYEAWTQTSTGLKFTINNWNLDEEGMILTDGTNTMVVPVKRVRLDPLGDVREYSIFTMGPGELVLSKVQLAPGITASLRANLLRVEATAMAAEETERRGTVELALGSLRGTIDFIQGHDITEFLRLDRASMPLFPAFGYGSGPTIEVSASGPWKAKIYNMASGPNPGFTFAGGGGVVTEITQEENHSDQVGLYTTGDNPQSEPRNSFVVFSLVSNEEVNRAVVLTQKAVTTLKISPQDTEIDFTPVGTPRGIPNAVPGNAFTFYIDPGTQEGVLNDWDAELSGEDAQYFELVKTSLGFSQKIEISAKGTASETGHANMQGRTLNAQIRIWLTGGNESGGTVEVIIKVQQGPVGYDYELVGIASVPVTGVIWSDRTKTKATGDYIKYKINIESSLRWKATVSSSSITDHPAFLIDHTGAPVTELRNQTSDDILCIGFDKIYYPLVSKTPMADIYIEVEEAPAINAIISVTQDALVPRYVNIVDAMNDNAPYGAIYGNGYYFRYYSHYIRRGNLFGPGGEVPTNGNVNIKSYGRNNFPLLPYIGTDGKGSQAQKDNAVAYVHMGGREAMYLPDVHLKRTEEWRQNTDAVLVWPHDEMMTFNSFDNPNSVLNKYTYKAPNGSGYSNNIIARDLDKRIIRYLVKDGPFTNHLTHWENSYLEARFYNDGICTGVDPDNLPEGAVAVITNVSSGAAMLVIDPVNRLVYLGESQFFDIGNVQYGDFTFSPTPATYKDMFLCNLIAYIVNAAQYGSHFTDYFIDGLLDDYPFPEK